MKKALWLPHRAVVWFVAVFANGYCPNDGHSRNQRQYPCRRDHGSWLHDYFRHRHHGHAGSDRALLSPNFTVTSPPNINMAAGIVLATSSVVGGGEEEDPPIPDTLGRRRDCTGGIGRFSLGLPGDPVIDAITGGTSFDAVSLTVTFVPTTTRTLQPALRLCHQ